MYGAGEFGDPFQVEAANTLSGIAMGQCDVMLRGSKNALIKVCAMAALK